MGGFIRTEEVSLPLRYIILIAHFVSVMTVAIGYVNLTKEITGVDPGNADETWSRAELDYYDTTKLEVQALSYAACGTMGVEIITFFMGVTIWFPAIQLFSIVFHTAGLVLTILFISLAWSTKTFIAFFTCFNAFPMVVELTILLWVTNWTFLKY